MVRRGRNDSPYLFLKLLKISNIFKNISYKEIREIQEIILGILEIISEIFRSSRNYRKNIFEK